MSNKVITSVFSLFCMLCSCATWSWQSTAYFDLGVAKIMGFSQIPKGGVEGSSSLERPTFSEMQIEHNRFYDIGFNLQTADYYGTFQYCHLSPHGSTMLTKDIETHNQFISAGRFFQTNVQYNWYMLNLGKYFHWQQWIIAPQLNANLVRYRYAFTSLAIASSRTFSPMSVGIGVNIKRTFNEKWFGECEANVTLPFSNLRITNADISLNYTAIKTNQWSLIPRFTLGFLQISYEDHQPLPNHTRATLWPLGMLGAAIIFNK